jgi:hypothetical protein
MDQKAAVVPGRNCFLTSALIVATLACNRVPIELSEASVTALPEKPRNDL